MVPNPGIKKWKNHYRRYSELQKWLHIELIPLIDKARQKFLEAHPLKKDGPANQNAKRNKRFDNYVSSYLKKTSENYIGRMELKLAQEKRLDSKDLNVSLMDAEEIFNLLGPETNLFYHEDKPIVQDKKSSNKASLEDDKSVANEIKRNMPELMATKLASYGLILKTETSEE